MRNLKFLAAFAALCILVYSIGSAQAGVSNPPNIPIPPNAAGWCTATALVPGTTRTTQIGDCPQAPPTSCPMGRVLRASIAYPPHLATRHNVDITQWVNIWGHASATDGITPWPGVPGTSPILKSIPRSGYIAAQFTVPAGSQANGFYKNVSNFGGLNVDMSISERCGDFAPVQPGCFKGNISPSDTGMVYWRMVNPTGFYCDLDPGKTYYTNIRNTMPTQVNANCAAGRPTCDIHVLSNATR